MYLTDYHTHSKLSPDGSYPLSAMADAALAAGLDELCLTDHYDLLEGDGRPAEAYDRAPAIDQFEKTAPQYEGRLKLKLGLEFGSPQIDPDLGARIAAAPELDFVIGSLHNWQGAHGNEDFYFTDYSDPKNCSDALTNHFDSMEKLVALPQCYDVLGHIIYPLRYMLRDGRQVDLTPWLDQIDGILKTAAQLGRGMEVNTWRGQSIEDWTPVLTRFKAHGGEIVTIGSDAHAPEGVGAGVRQAQALLQNLGFRYVATFEKRKVSFVKL